MGDFDGTPVHQLFLNKARQTNRPFPASRLAGANLKGRGPGTECGLSWWLVVLFEFEGKEEDSARRRRQRSSDSESSRITEGSCEG